MWAWRSGNMVSPEGGSGGDLEGLEAMFFAPTQRGARGTYVRGLFGYPERRPEVIR